MNTIINEKIKPIFRALRHRNYRLFFIGQCISLVGTWIQQIAMSWLIYRLTQSAFMMGAMVFVGAVPSLLASPFAGVFIDRINKYKTLIIVQALFMIQAFVLAILTLMGVIKIWHIIVLSVIMGLTAAIDMPLRQAFVVNLVEDSEDVGNAISLNSSSFNLARLIGPAIAGILTAAVGEGVCFLINALSYIAVIWALCLMNINYIPAKTSTTNVFEEFKEGLKYTLSCPPIRITISFIAISSLIGMAYPVLMPIFAKETLHGGAQTLGFLMSSSGIGALLGALYLAGRKHILGLEKWLCIASFLFGISIVCLSFVSHMALALISLFLSGFGMVIIIAACNTLIQHFVDDDKRGRVMSLFSMAFMGTAPIGGLFGGTVAEKIGVPHTFFIIGLFMILCAVIFTTKLKYFKIKGN